MMKPLSLLAALPLIMAATPAPEPAKTFPAPSEIVAEAPAEGWVGIAPADLRVMDLPADAKGRARRVVIQLMPAPFSQGWVGNIRKLVAARWYDGVSVNRVQDNYVVQWGDASEKKPLPEGLAVVPESEYQTRVEYAMLAIARAAIFAEPQLSAPSFRDAYAAMTGVSLGWPVAHARVIPKTPAQMRKSYRDPEARMAWPVHCYGMVGVGRGMSPDTGSGAELYTVIGHAPRHLDRNIALVGRVIEGIEHLSSLPRGTGPLGFYESAEERVPILSVRMGNEVAGLPAYEYLSTESPTFARYADARANRRDPFFIRPAGGADICNIPVPGRRVQ